MYYDSKIWIGSSEGEKVSILPKMANRHGLIAGATGTGKTTTLKVLAESFSDAGIPVFLTDVKGDLSGMIKQGADSDKMKERIESLSLSEAGFSYKSYPVAFWDIYGEAGIPLRTLVSEMGPLLLAKILNLNETQTNILVCIFKMADDEGLLLYDIKDLKAILQYASENAAELSATYGNISKNSIAAIIRSVVALEAAGGESFFSEPGINIADFFRNDFDGRGMINILDGRKLTQNPTMYSAFLLYFLSELFEILPEVGDLERPRMVFFFDEAHLLFDDISKALLSKVEQIVKLIRSKGVGIYFISQAPKDIPEGILGQLSNRIQHALRAYTPSEEKVIKAAADSFRSNPDFDTKAVLSELGVGEALISVLDEGGIPTVVKRCKILPPSSLMGPASEDDIKKSYTSNNLYLAYKDAKDSDSAFEFLERMRSQREFTMEQEKQAELERARMLKEEKEAEKLKAKEDAARAREAEKQKKKYKSAASSVARSAAGTVGREIGKSIGGSVGGSFGKKVGGNVMSQLGRSLMGTLFK